MLLTPEILTFDLSRDLVTVDSKIRHYKQIIINEPSSDSPMILLSTVYFKASPPMLIAVNT